MLQQADRAKAGWLRKAPRLICNSGVRRKNYKCEAKLPVLLFGDLRAFDDDRLGDVDHDAGLARCREPGAKRFDETCGHVACERRKLHVDFGQLDNDPVRVRERKDLVVDLAVEADDETSAHDAMRRNRRRGERNRGCDLQLVLALGWVDGVGRAHGGGGKNCR